MAKPASSLLFVELKRRTFLKASAVAGAGAGLVGLPFKALASDPDTPPSPIKADTKIVSGTCTSDCGSRCLLRHHVENNVVVRTETDDLQPDTEDYPQARACLKGRSTRQRLYTPNRLKYPMKRVGKRGEGRFERITWDEALDTIAASIKQIREKYGNEAFYTHHGMALIDSAVNNTWCTMSPFARMMNLYGGYLEYHDSYSSSQIHAAFNSMYGTYEGNTPDDMLNTDLVVNFGQNYGEMSLGGNVQFYGIQRDRKKRNYKMVYIDPRYSDTCLGREDQWIPIRPATDAALAAGLAWVMISEDLVDRAFLDNYCVGYDEKTLPEGAPANGHYKAYILGEGDDKTAKTPQWAEKITGVPAATIVKLAREMAAARRCCIVASRGINRHINGENTVRAVCALASLTGNVGISGGNTGLATAAWQMAYPSTLPTGTNPVKKTIPCTKWVEGIQRPLTRKKDGLKGGESTSTPIKFFWSYGSNGLATMHPDINHITKLVADESLLEMIVVIDNHMTPSAKFADILLPDLSSIEREEIVATSVNSGTDLRIYIKPAVTPMFENRDCYTICTGIAERLGIKDEFTEGRSVQDWLRWMHQQAEANMPGQIPSFEAFRESGILKVKGKPIIALESFRKDPIANPLKTPSGKIELYSTQMLEEGKEMELESWEKITALPEYLKAYRGYDDELAQKYPLQLVGWHSKKRANSVYDNVSLLREFPNQLWIHPIDAEARGIKHGDRIEVFNDKGRLTIEAKVTNRIMPGVTAMPIGAWYSPDKNGVCHNGSMNVLTFHGFSAYSKGSVQHTNLVDVRLWKGQE